MKYRALITLNLPDSGEDERSDFFESLKKVQWKKHPNIPSVWEKEFSEDLPIDTVIDHLMDDLNFVRSLSFVYYVEYALQIGRDSVMTGRMV